MMQHIELVMNRTTSKGPFCQWHQAWQQKLCCQLVLHLGLAIVIIGKIFWNASQADNLAGAVYDGCPECQKPCVMPQLDVGCYCSCLANAQLHAHRAGRAFCLSQRHSCHIQSHQVANGAG